MNILKNIAELLPSKEIKIFSRHGKQYVPNLQTVELTPLFRGRPVISKGLSDESKDALEIGRASCRERVYHPV